MRPAVKPAQTHQQEMNEQLAQTICEEALSHIRGKIERERQRHGFSTETYYAVKLPYAEGTEEYRYFSQMLCEGSMKDPNYIDLFERVLDGIKQEMEAEGVRSFVTLNCRFEPDKDDNFLLYVFASWETL